jgi:hypothetical protein
MSEISEIATPAETAGATPKPETSEPGPSPAATPGVSAAVNGTGPSTAVSIGTNTSTTTTIINEQRNVHQHLSVVKEYVEEDLILTTERAFSPADAEPLPPKLADELKSTFVCDDAVVSRLLRQLEERRVLLLTGSRDIGKRTAAVYLGMRLSAAVQSEQAPLVVESLERRVAVNLQTIAGDAAAFGGRATVFVDAFEQRNRQLHAFFNTVTPLKWAQLTEKLLKNGAYLIFTAATPSAPFRDRLTDHIAHCEWQEPDDGAIARAIDQIVRWIVAQDDVPQDRVGILTANRATIVSELKTLPRIASFIRQFLRDDVDLQNALRRFRDVSYWFRTALDRDLEGWTFVLTLALAQPARKATEVAWADFERLRWALLERLRSDPSFFGRRRKGEDDEQDQRLLGQVFCDDALLERCRAMVTKDATRLGDVIRFTHPSLAAELWETVLAHHRRVLMSILPVLRNIAEGDRDWSVRVLAAQMIGRLGEMDPARIALPIMHQWTDSDDRSRRPLVGRLAQGALGSRNDNYRDVVLRYIDLLSDVKSVGDPGLARDRLMTAIGTYGQIGVYEPMLAMDRLGTIVTEYLVPYLASFHEVVRAAESVQAQMNGGVPHRSALRQRRLRLSYLADQLFDEQAPALLAVEQTVVSLCILNDPIQILRAMRDWISRGKEKTGIMVAFLFLKDGIADDLQTVPAGVRALTGITGSPLLVSLVTGRNAVHHLCTFLLDVYASINTPFILPASMQIDLQERFWDCLALWARESVTHSDYRQAIEELFVKLGTLRRGVLQRDMNDALAGARFEGVAMRAFAITVLDQLENKKPRQEQ